MPKDNAPLIEPKDRLLLDEDELAELFGVSKPTVRSWVADGFIRRVELPGGIRRNLYRRSDADAFVASLAVKRSTL